MKRIPLIAVLLIVSMVLLASCASGPAAEKKVTPVSVAAVEMYKPVVGDLYSASIAPAQQVNLSFRVSGFVEEIRRVSAAGGQRGLEPGDVVAAGTVLARLRQQDYDIQVKQAEAQADSARQNEKTAQSQIDREQAAYVKAEADFNRAKALLASQSLTRPDFDSAQAQFDLTRAEVAGARTRLEAAAAQIRTAEASVASAELARQDTSLLAPFAGAIVQRNVEVGMLVSPSLQAYSLADISSVKATFGVPDSVAVGLRPGTAVSIDVEALPQHTFRGAVSALAAVADRDTRLFQVDVRLANPQRLLLPGMIARLSLGRQTPLPEVPVVPLSAVVRDRENAENFAVMVVEGDVARMRRVTLGPTYGELLTVTAGVKPGERVIRSGATMVTDGETVEVIP